MPTLDDFFAGYDPALHESANGWRVARDTDNPEIVRITLPASDGQFYTVRCKCDKYPEQAPSVVFVDAQGSQNTRSAWPNGNSEFLQIVKRPPHCFLCTALTREGLQHHGNWKTHSTAWNNTRTLLDIFNFLHRLLQSPNYSGRLKG